MFGTNPLSKKIPGDGHKLAIQSIFHTIQGEGPFTGSAAVFLRLAGCNLACYFCDTDFESKRRVVGTPEVVADIFALAAGNLEKPGPRRKTSLVVVTGGEPLLQNLSYLCKLLCLDYDFTVQIETAGTVWQDGLEPFLNSGRLVLVCSPKTGKVHEKIEQYCYDWKYLIREGCISGADGLPNKSTQVEGRDLKLFRPSRPKDTIWLQPCEVYKVNYKVVGFVNDGTQALDHLKQYPLADQQVTSSARDEEATKRNVELCAQLAMQFDYRVSVQLHKILGLP